MATPLENENANNVLKAAAALPLECRMALVSSLLFEAIEQTDGRSLAFAHRRGEDAVGVFAITGGKERLDRFLKTATSFIADDLPENRSMIQLDGETARKEMERRG